MTTEHDKLIAALQGAESGSRELSDRLLIEGLGWWDEGNGHVWNKPEKGHWCYAHERPTPTENMLHAFEAIPAPWWLVKVGHVDPEDRYGPIEACLAFGDSETMVFGRGATFPLAICVGIAKALAMKVEGK